MRWYRVTPRCALRFACSNDGDDVVSEWAYNATPSVLKGFKFERICIQGVDWAKPAAEIGHIQEECALKGQDATHGGLVRALCCVGKSFMLTPPPLVLSSSPCLSFVYSSSQTFFPAITTSLPQPPHGVPLQHLLRSSADITA